MPGRPGATGALAGSDPKSEQTSQGKQASGGAAVAQPLDKAAPSSGRAREELLRTSGGEEAPNDGQEPAGPLLTAPPTTEAASASVAETAAKQDAVELTSAESPNDPDDAADVTSLSGAAANIGSASGELAFAMRVSAGSANGQAGEAAATANPAGTKAFANELAANLAARQPEHAAAENGGPASFEASNGGGSESKTPDSSRTENTGEMHSPNFEAELDKFRHEPVRGVHVQLEGAENQRVDIRMVERSGQLSVTVRSGDPALTRSLQEKAAELGNSLQAERYQTELWKPGSGSGAGDGDARQEGRSTGGERGRQPSDSQQRRNKQQQTPDWVHRLEETSKSIQNRIEYTWQQ